MRSLNIVSRQLQTRLRVAPAGGRWVSLFACATLAAMALAPAARAQLLYWDANGGTAGAGAAPTGGWDSSLFWSTDPNGETGTAAWAPGSTAVFSAGTDAVGPFIVTLDAAQSAAGLVFEEGNVTLTGLTPATNLTWNGSVNVASGATAALNVLMLGSGGLTKTGSGTVVLGATNNFAGDVVINGGTLSFSSDGNLTSQLGASPASVAPGAITINDSVLRFTGGVITFHTNRGITLGGSGGTIEVTQPQGTGILLFDGTNRAGISGSVLTKTGIGEIRIFQATNTFSKLVIDQGAVAMGQSAFAGFDECYGAVPTTLLPDAVTIRNGATNRTIGGATVTTHANRGFTLGAGGGVFRSDVQALVINGPITGPGGLTKFAARNLTLNGFLDYAGPTLIDCQNATVTATLASSNNATGSLAMNAGILTLNGNNAFSSVQFRGGRINVNTNLCLGSGPISISPTQNIIFANASVASPSVVTLPNDITLNASAFVTDIAANQNRELVLSGKISGDAHWKKDNSSGLGALVLGNANNDFTGTVTNIAGTLIAAANNALGSTSGGTVINNGVSLAFRGGIDYSAAEPVTITGMGRLGFGALSNDSGNCSFAGPVTMIGNSGVGGAAGTTLTLTGGIGESGGSFALSKLTAGNVRLTANNTYSGGTLISNGVLIVANTTGSATGPGPVTVFPGASLSGPGSVAGSVIVNGTISPGSSPGTQNTGSETWNGGGTYVWEINDVDAGQGANPGWDLINITGSLTIGATPGNKFTLDIRSLDLANAAGNVADFDNSTDYTWTILKTTAGITGFDAAAFNVISSGFSNPRGNGLFLVESANGGNDLVIRFVRTPAIAAQPANQSAECATGSATFTVGATGTAPLTYQWRHNGTDILGANAATLSITPTTAATAGSYDVVVANAHGSATSTSASLTLVDTAPPVITSCAPSATLSGNANCQVAIPDLTAAVVASDTCNPVTRSQNPLAGTLVGLGTHTVTITISDAANNQATCQATVTVNDTTPPVITACANNQTNIAALPSCQSAIPDLTVQVATSDNCAGLVTVTQSPLAGTLVGVGSHVVTLTATDAANNTATCQATVTVVSGVAVTVNSPTVCPGGSTMLTATTAAASPTFLWSPGGANTASIPVSPTETTVYTVTVTDGTTGCTGSGSGTVTVGSALLVTVNSATICTGGSAQLTATTDATGPTYLWSPGGATTASITVSPTETTTYTVTITDGTGCTGLGSGTVTVKQPVTFANSGAISINDNGAASPYPSAISVSGQTATVCRVSVTLSNISHAFPDDIDIVLVGPNGQGVLLMSDVGNADSLSGVTLTFDDSAAVSLPDAGPIVSGAYKPTNYGSKDDGRPDNFSAPAPVAKFGTNLSAFAGINPNGAWSLYVVDDEAVDFGTISGGWSIAVTTLTPFADVSVTQTSIPNPVAVGSNLTFLVTVANNGPAVAANISLADTLPAGVAFVSATASQGSCTPSVGSVSCSLGSLLAGGSATVSIVVVPSVNSIIANSADVTSTTLDFVTANNTSSTSATVLDPPVITVQPLTQTVCADHAVALSVTAAGSAPFSYQWAKGGLPIGGATASTFTINAAQPGDSGNYTVTVANSVGTTVSTIAVVTVNPLPTVAVNSQTICLGASAILSATTSAASPSYLWSPGGATNPSITVSPASTTIYTVLVTDGVTGCTNSASGTVTVTPLTAATPIQSYTNICPGSPVTFGTVASGTPPFTYEWRKGGVAIGGQTADTLSLPSVVLADSGTYSVVVTGTCGAVTNSGTLSVVAPPTITAQPQNQVTPMGNGAVFTVAASSVVTSNIQWQLNGVDIPGANSTSLAVSNVTLLQNGELYRAVVSNCGGSATSVAATLTVTPISGISFDFDTPLQFTNQPSYLTYNNWLHSGFVTPLPLFETSVGGVGAFPGSGALDSPANNGTDASSILLPVTWDFSLPGKTLYASTMFKVKTPVTAGRRSTQMGFITSTNFGINDNNPQAFMSVIIQSPTANSPVFEFRTQRRTSGGGLQESVSSAPQTSLTVSNWYRLTAVFSNTVSLAASNFAITATLQEMGPNGTAPGATVMSFATTTNTSDITRSKNVYFAIRGFEDGGMDIRDNTYVYTTPGNVFFVQQPQNQTVLQGRRAQFRALVDGAGIYSYQWLKNGNPIPGARSWNYITPAATTGDNGAQYSVQVTGPANTVTSDPATLTVQSETLAVVSAGSVDGSTVGVQFSQPVDPATAENPANYTINGVAAAQARVFRTPVGPMGPEGIYVVLTPASILSGSFTVAVSGVQNLSGGALGAGNSASGAVEGLTGYDVNPGVTAPAGEQYSFGPGQFIVTGGGADIFNQADQYHYLYTIKTGDFDVKTKVPYQTLVRAPSKAGFDARTWLDPFSPHVAAGLNPVGGQVGGAGSFGRSYSEGVIRQTYNVATTSWGNNTQVLYPNAWLRFRRVGNVFMRYTSTNGVNWLFDGQITPSPTLPSTVYLGLAVCSVANNVPHTAQLESYGAFAGYPGATIAIGSQPTNITFAAGAAATIGGLSASVSGGGIPAGGELVYLWQRSDGAGGWTNMPSAGATNNLLSVGTVFGSDNGAQYRAIVMAPGVLSVTSSVATLTVTDTTVPTVASVNSTILPAYPVSDVTITFSEPVSAATALNIANYTVTNAAGVRLTVLSATFLAGDPRTVVVKVDGPLGLGNASVGISGVRDANNNLLATTVRSFRSFHPSTAPVVAEIFMDIGGSGAITGLTATNLFTNSQPTFIVYSNLFGYNVSLAGSTLSGLNFSAGTVAADNYGVKVYSYFVPPTNGNYKFWIRGDDGMQLFMNTNGTSPAGKVLIAENAANVANYGVGSTPANSITNIPLVGGQSYYLELLGKEGGGGDGWSVMWTDPVVTAAPANTVFIPTANLAYPAAAAPAAPVITEIYTAYPSFILDRANAVGLGLATNFPTDTYQGSVVNFKYIAGLPDYVAYQKNFATQPTLYNTRYDDYLGRMLTYFVAPSNGVYRFWMRSDDASQLYMNTNAVNSTDPAGKKLIGRLDVFTGSYSPVANNISLVGGQRYYLEALWKEGGGGDGVAVAVRAQSDPGTPFLGPTGTAPSTGGPTEVIPASMLEYPLAVGRAGAINFGIAPVNPAVIDGQPLVLSAAAVTGSGPYGGFTWYKNGVKVLENSFTNYTPPLTMADNGAVYTLVATNFFSVASNSVTVTVLPDATAPTVVTCVGYRYGDGFSITYSEPMDALTATYLGNYQVSGGLKLLSASLDPSRRIVMFQTSPQAADTVYTVTINGVRDASSAGNSVAANTIRTFSTWMVGGNGFLVEMWTNIPGSTIPELTGQPKFIANTPDVLYYTNLFGVGPFNANSGLENYGARISGYFMPPSSGFYRFFMRSDDQSMLFMNVNNTDSANPAGRTFLAHVPGANLGYTNLNASTVPLALNQGQRYYVEALLKEGTGGDYVNVTFRNTDASGNVLGVPIDGLSNVATEIASNTSFDGVPGNPDAITIQQVPPSELFVKENDSVTLKLVAGIPISMPRAVTYQWQKFDGLAFVNIAGAREPSLAFVAALADNLARFRLLFSAPGKVASYETLLHVSPDNVGPKMVAAGSIDDGTHIGIEYSEPIPGDVAIDTFLYEVNGGQNAVLGSEPRADGKSVVLTVSPPVTGTFHVVATEVRDTHPAGNLGSSEIDGKVYGFAPSDVGGPAAIGSSFAVRDGEIDVIAGGADVWGASDQGHLTLTPRYGDFDIWARVQSLKLSDAISKAGLMVRESTNAASRVVHVQVNPPYQLGGRDLGEAAQRINTGAATALMPGAASYTPVGIPNAWVRMKREGDRFTAFRSDNGSNWASVGTTTLVMPDQVLIGLTTCAHNNAAPATLAEYRNVHIPNTPTILTQPAPAAQTVAAHSTVTYSVVASNPPNSGSLTYQWRKDGLKIPGATGSSLTINNLQSSQAGIYTVWVGNDGGSTISASATLTVGNAVPVAVADTVNTTVNTPVLTPAATLVANDTDPESESLSVLAVSGLAPVSFVSDFNNGLPAGATMFGTATAEATGGVGGSGYLRLNPSVVNQAGALVLDELTPRRRVAAFTASFKLRIAEGSAEPADGFSFNFGPDVTIGTAAAAENGTGTGLSFCVDNYRFMPYPGGGTAVTSGMKLRFGGGDLTGVQTITWDKDAFVPVTVSLDASGRVTVLVDGTNVFGNIVVPWTPRPGRFAFYGRTGGERQAHAIDDLSITTVLTVETMREASLNAGIFGSAYIDGGFLHLNDAAGSVAGSFILNELTPGVPITSFTANFKLRIGNGSAEPADGFSFNFANDLPIAASTPAAAENGGGTGFSFCVDNYRFDPFPGGGTANTSGMKIRLGGVDVAGVRMPTWNTTAFIPVSITIASDGALTVLVDGTNVFGTLVLPVSPTIGRFGLYGRTGGQLETHWVDDLNIAVTTAGSPATYSANFNSGGFGTVALNNGIVTYSPPAGACGSDAYYYLVSDASGAVSVGTVTVNIDPGTPQPPVITACVPPRTVQVGANCTLALPDLTSALIVNDCAAFVVRQSPAAGTLVGIGATTVTLTVSNSFGLTATCQTTVTVVDTTPPQVVTCPAPVLLNADAQCVATMPDLRPQFAAVDNCPITVSQTPAPGTVLALGITPVTLTATDGNGNSTNCLTSVTVQDITPPAIVCPANQTASCASSAGAVVSFTSTATDNCTALVPVVCTPASGSTFAIGVTTVTCVATDGANNISSCNFTVTVSDSPRPTMTIVKQTGGVLIRWPQTCTPYILEATANLVGTPVWTPVTAPVVPVGGNNEVTISPADGNKFYRLTKQQ